MSLFMKYEYMTKNKEAIEYIYSKRKVYDTCKEFKGSEYLFYMKLDDRKRVGHGKISGTEIAICWGSLWSYINVATFGCFYKGKRYGRNVEYDFENK